MGCAPVGQVRTPEPQSPRLQSVSDPAHRTCVPVLAGSDITSNCFHSPLRPAAVAPASLLSGPDSPFPIACRGWYSRAPKRSPLLRPSRLPSWPDLAADIRTSGRGRSSCLHTSLLPRSQSPLSSAQSLPPLPLPADRTGHISSLTVFA